MPGATGDYRTEFHAKAAAVAEALIGGRRDFVFLHVKAVDDTGHDRQPAQKVGRVCGRRMARVSTPDGIRVMVVGKKVKCPAGLAQR